VQKYNHFFVLNLKKYITFVPDKAERKVQKTMIRMFAGKVGLGLYGKDLTDHLFPIQKTR
jgi:hypothetical protein